MSGTFLPGATVILGRDGGSMLGGPAKAVWHTTENDPAHTSAANVAHYLAGTGNTVHLIWHPLTGEIIQMIPANLAGRGLENHPGGVETNRSGRVVIQIEVVGRASQPFTSGPMVGLPTIQAWLASLGIPHVWAGTPDRSAANWAKSGHFGHMDVPENSHTDPGNVDKAELVGAPAAPHTPPPPTRKARTMHVIRSKTDPKIYVTDGMTKRWAGNAAALSDALKQSWQSSPEVVSQDYLDSIPDQVKA